MRRESSYEEQQQRNQAAKAIKEQRHLDRSRDKSFSERNATLKSPGSSGGAR